MSVRSSAICKNGPQKNPINPGKWKVIKPFSILCQLVDWSWNRYADKKFQFIDHSLVAHVRSKKDKDAMEFFKLLSLCHTVMVEHKDGNPTVT